LYPVHYILLAALVVIAFYTDAKNNKIPNLLCVVGTLVGLFYHLIASGFTGLLFSLGGLASGFVIMLVLYLFKIVGAGDVKLFAAVGSFAGTQFTLYTIMYSIVYGGIIGLVILLVRRETRTRIFAVFIRFLRLKHENKAEVLAEQKKESLHFPFMYAVLPAVLTTFYYMIR
jgi:prepilin peptidase CpaA